MELKNRIINFLGDSITEGVGTTGPDQQYVHLIEYRCGLKRANNYGISGTRLARQIRPTADAPRFDLDFCGRCTDMDREADINVVFGGTNDYGHGDAPIGTPDDRTPDTYWGACHYLCRTLIETYPHAVHVICTPLHRLGENNPSAGNGLPLSRYVEILREVAAYYAVPVLDLWKVSGLQPEVPTVQRLYMPDGLHPSDAGNAVLADRIIGFLKAL